MGDGRFHHRIAQGQLCRGRSVKRRGVFLQRKRAQGCAARVGATDEQPRLALLGDCAPRLVAVTDPCFQRSGVAHRVGLGVADLEEPGRALVAAQPPACIPERRPILHLVGRVFAGDRAVGIELAHGLPAVAQGEAEERAVVQRGIGPPIAPGPVDMPGAQHFGRGHGEHLVDIAAKDQQRNQRQPHPQAAQPWRGHARGQPLRCLRRAHAQQQRPGHEKDVDMGARLAGEAQHDDQQRAEPEPEQPRRRRGLGREQDGQQRNQRDGDPPVASAECGPGRLPRGQHDARHQDRPGDQSATRPQAVLVSRHQQHDHAADQRQRVIGRAVGRQPRPQVGHIVDREALAGDAPFYQVGIGGVKLAVGEEGRVKEREQPRAQADGRGQPAPQRAALAGVAAPEQRDQQQRGDGCQPRFVVRPQPCGQQQRGQQQPATDLPRLLPQPHQDQQGQAAHEQHQALILHDARKADEEAVHRQQQQRGNARHRPPQPPPQPKGRGQRS